MSGSRTKQRVVSGRGGRPRDVRLARAVRLIDIVALSGLNLRRIKELRGEPMPQALEHLIAILSKRARRAGQLSLTDARMILAYLMKGDARRFGNLERAEKRARRDSGGQGEPPSLLAPDPATICTCAHHHCSEVCLAWAPAPASCGRLIAQGSGKSLPEPCRLSARECRCRHVHCERCGIGASLHRPIMQPAYTVRLVPQEVDVERIWLGWRCPDCMPDELKAIAQPDLQAEHLQAEHHWVHPACPRCGGDAVIDGALFRCNGLDGESNRLRVKVQVQESLKMKLIGPHGFASPAEVAAFRAEQLELLNSLPDKLPALAACGRSGPVGHISSEQAWRRAR